MGPCLSLQWCNEMCVKFGVSYRGLLWQVLVRYRVAIQRGTQGVLVFPRRSQCRLLENLQRCSNEQGSESTDLIVRKGLPKPLAAFRRLVTQRNCVCSLIRTCRSTRKCGPLRERGTTTLARRRAIRCVAVGVVTNSRHAEGSFLR